MVVRRSDSRRRRVVVDPVLQAAEAVADAPVPAGKKSKRESSLYSQGANRRHQKKTTDLIPKRVRAYCLVLLLLVAVVGGLNFLALHATEWADQIGAEGVSSLQLTGRGTLAGWFSSFLLIISGLASLQIYALRQHRRDDYKGSYRLWLWMAMLLMLGSVNCVVDVVSIGSSLVTSFTGSSWAGNSWLPLGIKLGLLLLLVARGVYEVRESRGSFALVLFVWVAYSAAAVMQLPAVEPVLTQRAYGLIQGNCFLWAAVAVLMAEITFARFIFLQAHGLIKPRAAQVKVAKAKKTSKVKSVRGQRKKTDVSQDKKQKEKQKRNSKQVKRSASADKVGEKDGTGIGSPASATPDATSSGTPELKIAGATVSSGKRGKKARSSQSKAQSADSNAVSDRDGEDEGILRMSKSERRKLRKQDQQRRAA